MRKITPILLLMLQMNLHAQGLNEDYSGTWEGNWFNTTFSSTGPMYMEFSFNESDMTYMTYGDIDGNVFGGGEPPPTQGQGSFTTNNGVLSIQSQGSILGNVSLNIDTNTSEVSLEAVPGNGIDQYSIEGTATSQEMNLEFTMVFTGGGGANGTIDLTKTSQVTSFLETEGETSFEKAFSLKQNFPNPFNPTTTISYILDKDSDVSINIFDISGKLISTLQNKYQNQGEHSIIWNGTNGQGIQVPAGIYLSKITSGNEIRTSKMILLK